MRVQVAGIIVNTLKSLDLAYPTADTSSFKDYKKQLLAET
jgi:hypothetical protein